MTDSYDIQLTKRAKRDLNGLPPRILEAVLAFLGGDLARNPQRVGKPLRQPFLGLHSAVRGPYRVLYEIRELEVVIVVVHIDHRVDVYRP